MGCKLQDMRLHSACYLPYLPLHFVCLSVSSQVHQLEFILDSLVDEKDRSTQKRGDAAGGRPEGARTGHASTNSTSDGSSQLSLEISVTRPAEIEAALQQFVSPKVTEPYAGNGSVHSAHSQAQIRFKAQDALYLLI